MSGSDLTYRYEALFASDLQSSQRPSARQVRAAIHRMLRTVGVSDCAARVAQEFGDHPETSVLRMRWARRAVSDAYSAASRGWSLRSAQRLPFTDVREIASVH